LKLVVLNGELAVARLGADEAIPPWAAEGGVSSVTRTADELSVVCAAAGVPSNVRAERGWRCLQVVGNLDFSLTGVLASIAAPLAAAELSIFAISTYDTDYVLVRERDLAEAIGCLKAAGHEVGVLP
jgi:hypothetical protein